MYRIDGDSSLLFFFSLRGGELGCRERAFFKERYVLISGGTPCLISELSLVLYLYTVVKCCICIAVTNCP